MLNGSWILVYSYNELQQWKNAQQKYISSEIKKNNENTENTE